MVYSSTGNPETPQSQYFLLICGEEYEKLKMDAA